MSFYQVIDSDIDLILFLYGAVLLGVFVSVVIITPNLHITGENPYIDLGIGFANQSCINDG